MFEKVLKIISDCIRRLIYRRRYGKKDISDTSSSADFSEAPRFSPSREEVELTPLPEIHKQSVARAQNLEDTAEQDEIDATDGIGVSQSTTVDNATGTNPPVKGIDPTPSMSENEESLSHHHGFNAYSEAPETPEDQKIAAHNASIVQLSDSGESDQGDVISVDSGHDQIRNESEPPASNLGGSEETPSLLLDYNSDIRAKSPLDSDTLASVSGGTQGALERPSSEVAKSKEKDKAKRKRPHNIKGRRSRSVNSRRESGSRRPNISRPELICRRDPASMAWEIILTADEDCKLSAVQLRDEFIEHSAQRCHIPSFTGRLIVSCQDEQRHDVPLFDGNPLIFKLRKNWSGEGRKIARITSGHFIVIAPALWERTGHAPVEPDSCADTAFRAHYFHRDAAVTDDTAGGFREWGGSPVATGIELIGRNIYDDSDHGMLFVGDPPDIKPSPEIEWARVGEETEQDWAQNFQPDLQSLSEVLSGREGRFFLRVYDSEVRMLDSVAFRYVRDLRRINVNGTEYAQGTVLMPGKTGYPRTEICLVGADGSTLTPVLPPQAQQEIAPSGVVEVPPLPNADCVTCSLGSDVRDVKIALDLPRIWWCLEDGRSDSAAWRDNPLVMTRKEFRNHAYADVTLSVLSRRHSSVRAGFDDQLDQQYSRSIEDNRIAIPLAHFVDHAQIDRRLNEDAHFNVRWAEEVVPLIVISADPMPEILSFTAEPATIVAGKEALLEWTTRNTGDARVSIDPSVGVVDGAGTFTVCPSKTTRYTLTLAVSDTEGISSTVKVTVERLSVPGRRPVARVMSSRGGWRRGKGFSLGELQDAGVTVKEAAERSIPIDRRRRSSHPANVEKIRRMLYV